MNDASLPRYLRAPIAIDLACNDENGYTIDRVDAIQLPGLDLSAIALQGVHFRQVRGAFWISRRKWFAQHVASHVGNVCWERYAMTAWRTAAFLLWLRSSNLFDVDGGYDELFRWWQSGVDGIAGDVLQRYVSRLLSSAASEESCL